MMQMIQMNLHWRLALRLKMTPTLRREPSPTSMRIIPKKGRGKESPREENDAKAQELTKYEKCNKYADDKLSDLRSPVKMYCDDS